MTFAIDFAVLTSSMTGIRIRVRFCKNNFSLKGVFE